MNPLWPGHGQERKQECRVNAVAMNRNNSAGIHAMAGGALLNHLICGELKSALFCLVPDKLSH